MVLLFAWHGMVLHLVFLGSADKNSRGQYYLHNKPILSSLVQLAVAQLVDLGLNKAIPRDMPYLLLEYDAQGCSERYCQPQERTVEERRVVVGCFLVTSV